MIDEASLKNILPACLLAESAGKPTFAGATRSCDDEASPLADPAAGGELEEQRHLRQAASVEDVDYRATRGLDRAPRAPASLTHPAPRFHSAASAVIVKISCTKAARNSAALCSNCISNERKRQVHCNLENE
jgi:hypothetical protein